METTDTQILVPGAIDSPLKLHLLMLFRHNSKLCCDARRLTDWLHHSPWAVEEALEELADTGFLARVSGHSRTHYRLDPCACLGNALDLVAVSYNDPLRRDRVLDLVRAANQEQQFQSWIARERCVGEQCPLFSYSLA